MTSLMAGLMLGLSLIIAIGAQNIWVLSQSMAGASRLVIAAVCIGCDASLILLGVYAASQLQQLLPALLPLLTWGGVAMLLYLAFAAGKRAWQGNSGLLLHEGTRQSRWQTALTALAISLLNPHVYLDTVVLLGSIGALQPEPALFAIGACIGSVLWFGSLTAMAPRLKQLLSSPKRWRLFDSLIALMLCVIAWQLAHY